MFPTNPQVNDTQDEYIYDGEKWVKSKNLEVNTFRSKKQIAFSGSNIGSSHQILYADIYKPLTIHTNTDNCFNTTTGKFTASKDGVYFISFDGLMLMSGATSHAYVRFWKNDVDTNDKAHSSISYTRDYNTLSSSRFFNLVVGDTIHVDVVNPGPANGQSQYAQSSTYAGIYTGMNITFIR